MDKLDLKPEQILDTALNTSEVKASSSFSKLMILGILAGSFIAFAAQGSTMAAFNLLLDSNTFGLGKALAGAIFATGLMMVVMGGGELFTGNTLMLAGLIDRRIKLSSMIRNWVIIYIANFIGSMIIVILINYSGQLMNADAMLGAMALKIAAGKVNLSFLQAFCLGILCNWLVCMAVWMAYGAKSLAGKAICIFFPIWLFITSGFEHSVANMYYIPIGIFIKSNNVIAEASGLPPEILDNLNWGTFFVNNLLPVTIGNIIGGGIFVGIAYYIAFRKKTKVG